MSAGPQTVGALIDQHATLRVELSLRGADVAPGGQLNLGWKALLLRHAG